MKEEFKIHELKCWPEPFLAIQRGDKTFEYRINDRDYQVGDKLWLSKFCPQRGYLGIILLVEVTYVLTEGFGIPEGYCIMSIKRL